MNENELNSNPQYDNDSNLENHENNNVSDCTFETAETSETSQSQSEHVATNSQQHTSSDNDGSSCFDNLFDDLGHQTSRKSSFSFLPSVIVSVVSTVVVVCILFALAAYFPSKEKSFLASFFNDTPKLSGQTSNPSGTDVTIGDNVIQKGDDVTINISGESEIAQAVYAKAANSVVGIAVSKESGSKWNKTESIVTMGSGVVYSADGLIITNHHVVEKSIDPTTGKLSSSFNIKIYFNTDLTEWAYASEILGFDAENDIALLRAEATNLNPIEFADSDNLITGETAISIGSPGGLPYMNSVSEGILSGINRSISTGTSVVYDLIQTTAAINPGNSGGALLNSKGQLIGICVIKIAATNYESMGFAINSNTVKTIVESILKYGYYNKPTIGVIINSTYTKSIALKEGWELGAYVDQVYPDSPASKAGIVIGDVITKIEDTTISSFASLRRFLLDYKPGDTVSITLFNTDSLETRTISLTLCDSEK